MSEPTLAEIFRLAADARERELFTSLVAVVKKYDPGSSVPPKSPPTVDVLPVIKRALPSAGGGTAHEELPVITNVPLVFPSSGNFSMTWPIAAGDHVLLMCTNWSHQQWRETGSVSEPGDLRTHEPANAFAIAGVLPKSGGLPTATDAAVIEVNAPITHVTIGAGASQFVSLSNLVAAVLDSIGSAIAGATVGSSDGGALFKSNIIAALGSSGWTSGGTVAPPTAATKLKSE